MMWNNNCQPILDVSVTSSFGSPIMFSPKRGLEASAGVLKDILLGDESNNNSFNSHADFADFDEMSRFEAPQPPRPVMKQQQTYNVNEQQHLMHSIQYQRHPSMRYYEGDVRRSSRSAHHPGSMTSSHLDLRRVGSQINRPHSHSPGRIQTGRRYSPPQGSTGTKSPESTPRTSWDHTAAPLSTSSPMTSRRAAAGQSRAPYYVADTVRHDSLEVPYYMDHNSSSGSGGSVFPHVHPHASYPGGGHQVHHHHQHQHQHQHHPDLSMASAYDESLYRLLPPGSPPPPPCWTSGAGPPSAASCFAMTDEELHREYAVVLDAILAQNCCSISSSSGGGAPPPDQQRALLHQIAAESRREQSCSGGFQHPYYSNWQTCPQQQPQQHQHCYVRTSGLEQQQQQNHHIHHQILVPADQETCVDDETCEVQSCQQLDDEMMVSSWTGVCGVPGLGFSIPPKDEDLEAVESEAAAIHAAAKQEWSANSAQSLAALKVDLPRVAANQYGGQQPPVLEGKTSSSSRPSASKNLPRLSSKKSINSGYNGVSAVSHLMTDRQYFQRHDPKSAVNKQPLRATVSSRLHGGKFSVPSRPPSSTSATAELDRYGPSSLPSQFIPRAPIPTPEALLASKNKKKKSITGLKTKSLSSKKAEFSANNAAILAAREHHIYKTPNDRDGDYSYAYDCSISPAVVIKWNEECDEEDEDQDDDDIDEVNNKEANNKKNNENIYEEIDDVAARRRENESGNSGNSSVNNSDSGIGGAIVKSSNLSSMSSSSGTSSSHHPHHQHPPIGTLDVSRPRKKATVEAVASDQHQPPSSLDVLLSQTTPDLTPHQRVNLRKSLVDELFEELVQRHHKRVLDELRLDVEEFIAPSPIASPVASGDNNPPVVVSTPKSVRSVNSSRLTRCESMDFKTPDPSLKKQNQSSAPQASQQKKITVKFWQSARKCSEVIQRKLKKSSSSDKTSAGEPTRRDQSQVTRRGRRPLSAIVTSSRGFENVIERGNPGMDYDSDNEQDAERRLLRSQIIKSFWKKHDEEEAAEAAEAASNKSSPGPGGRRQNNGGHR